MWFSFFITWEQRKLGEAANIYDGVHQTPDYKDSGIMFLSVENISTLKSRKYISEEAFTRDYKVYPQKGDILMTRIGDVGTPNVVESTEKLAFYVSLALLKPINVDSYFLCNSILSPLFQRGLKERTLVTAIPQKINKDEIGKVSFFVPNSRDEQKQIGTFFANLDNLITLHQRKQNLGFRRVDGKKSFLILANDWEQRKLGEYFIERNERSGEGELISVTINAGIKKFNELGRFDTKPEDLSKYKRVEVGDIAYNSMRMWQGASGYSSYSGILSPAYTVISPKTGVSSLFFAYLIKRPQMIHLFEINSQGLTSDTWNLKFPAFSKIEASAPSDIDEQENISELFTVLDNLITLHQRKLNSCCEYKAEFSNLQKCDELANDWEQRKLGDIFERIVRKNVNNESSLPLTISAQDGLVDQITYFNNRVASRDVSNYYLVLNGEFAYNKSTSDGYPYGAVKRLDLYEKGVLSTLYIVFALKDDAKTDSDYMAVFFDTDRWHRGVAERAAEGARNHGLLNIAAKDFFDISIFLPRSIGEQQKIGRVLKRLDNLITLHQCKLSRFFSIKNTSFSCRTRAEDTFAWEQRKVQDVADRYDNLRIPVAANLRVSGNIPYYGANGIQDYVDGFTHEGEFVLVAEDGANDLKNYPVQHVQGRIWVNNHAHVLQGKPALMNNLFLAYSLHRADIASFLVGGSRAKLNADTLMTLELLLPSVEEQTKIGITLAAVDNLITLHQRGEKYITGDEHDKRHKTK